MRSFNTAGPCRPDWHYMVEPLGRLEEARDAVAERGYFVVHAPRQTGKTTTLDALAEALTREGRFACVHFSCEAGQAAGDDYAEAQRALLLDLRLAAESSLPPELHPPDPWPTTESTLGLLRVALTAWSQSCPRPLVLFFDEIDALRGRSLEAVLRQLRAGYPTRPERFPWSVALCGLRDVRDYRATARGDGARLGSASPFNVQVESLRMTGFCEDDVGALYRQHTAETGQR